MKYLGILLKGLLMGICDIIPGISGGTIAFITGIYERLINAVKGFSGELFFSIITGKDFKQNFKKIDLPFLIPLGIGIGSALFLGSKVVKYLLDNHFSLTIAFFIGLILASSKIIFNNIKNHKGKDVIFCVFGLLVGISLIFLIPATVTPSLLYIMFGGFVGISAMFLPGISGAFILLIMGIYEHMIGVLHDLMNNFVPFISFGIGAALGAFSISRIVSYLFKVDKSKTLYFLLGLVLGALSIPVNRIVQDAQSLNTVNVIVMVVLALVGMMIVKFVEKV